jgi:bifunctional non-homologous end joining protein LigD
MCPTRSSKAPSSKPVAVQGVTITTPQRVMYPKLAVTKLELAKLYTDIAPWVLPHLQGRPLTLVRCEHGAGATDALRTECKFLRHTEGWHRWVPPFVRRVQIPEQKKIGEYLIIDSLEALLAIVNGDILELHTWNSKTEHLEQPDRLVFDLDPGAEVRWPLLATATLVVRQRLEAHGLESWLKSTGGKGLHIVVPIEPVAGWDECFAFSRAFAESIVREFPDVFTVSFSKSARQRKILIDYKRNHRTAIAVAAFSTRARPEATMSVPLSWDELDPQRPLAACTVRNVRERVGSWTADVWEGYWLARQHLQPTAERSRDANASARQRRA